MRCILYNLKRDNFKEIYKAKGFKQPDVAKGIGVSLDTVKSWTRTGSTISPDETNIKSLIKFLQCRIEDIAEIDKDFVVSKTRTTYRPLIGSASCGVPTTYYYDDVEMLAAPDGVGKNSYYVKADGDSMTPRINSGDLILCDPDCEVSSGNVVHFEWDGEHGVKRYVEQGNVRMMVSTNSDYQPLIITNEYELKMTRCIQVTADL